MVFIQEFVCTFFHTLVIVVEYKLTWVNAYSHVSRLLDGKVNRVTDGRACVITVPLFES